VSGSVDPCDKCEEVMQQYLDRSLSSAEVEEAERHLQGCPHCAKRYRFEESLRQFVRKACSEPIPPELKERLAALRTPLT
jgi:anti-sigma factor (TIGR02949 family)